MAVLIDAQGRIASEVAAGGPAVLTLANDPHQMKVLLAITGSYPDSPQAEPYFGFGLLCVFGWLKAT